MRLWLSPGSVENFQAIMPYCTNEELMTALEDLKRSEIDYLRLEVVRREAEKRGLIHE